LADDSNTKVSNQNQVLGENISLPISLSTQLEGESQNHEDTSLLSTDSNAQVSNDEQVLGENILHLNSPSTHRKRGEGSGNISWS
jgi:hypothetical protein